MEATKTVTEYFPAKKMKAMSKKYEMQKFSEHLSVPVFDLSAFLKSKDDEEIRATCRDMAQAMRETSILIVRDPRVSKSDAGTFLDTMEQYFSQPQKDLMEDVHPELHYQVGATPEKTEKAICALKDECKDVIAALKDSDKPHVKEDQGADPKWRFFWRIGERPTATETEFAELNAPQVIPKKFKKSWSNVMNTWGSKMLAALSTSAEMLAIGFDLPRDSFTKMMKGAPHLLAPTGSNLEKYREPETVFATFHQDLNFLTIHGKSRYPGLYIWLRDGTKVPVKMPEGCLLLQCGIQMEHLTGGHCVAGYHEVIATEAALQRAKRAKSEGRPPWRVSSTLFGHIQSDQVLRPLGAFGASKAANEKGWDDP
eukprot:g2964.t1